jgi:hypothetical protein
MTLIYGHEIRVPPNVKIEDIGDSWDDKLRIGWLADDARGSGRMINLTVDTVIFQPQDASHVGKALYSALTLLFQHEIDEWLTVNGDHVKDPHPEVL